MTQSSAPPRQVWIAGEWRDSHACGTFRAYNPRTGAPLPFEFPVSAWRDCDQALQAAAQAFAVLRTLPGERLASLLENCAMEMERCSAELVATAHLETGLAIVPRLRDVELPRTTGQLRQAADAARSGSWLYPTVDTVHNVRSCRAPIGPVAVFGPNNFPFAFGSVSGGDFAAALAAGNPVIAKANSSHPETTRLMAQAVWSAVQATDMPAGTIQMIYRTSHADGERLVADPRIAATAYTGSRAAGLKLKQAAEAVGKLIFLELSSCNPVVILPGALQERGEQIADEFASSCLMGTGQFCTNPGLILLLAHECSERFVDHAVARFRRQDPGVLLSTGVRANLTESIQEIRSAGAELLVGGTVLNGGGFSVHNTLLRVSGDQFLADPVRFQTELFGNAALLVMHHDADQLIAVVDHLEGNLTGCVYSHSQNRDESLYDRVAAALRFRVGRLLNDRMPTGVTVSPAMNHGGPYPSTGSPHFTAVGMPAAIARFTALHAYDQVRPSRLPACLREQSPNPQLWRQVDDKWMQGDIEDS